MCQGFSLLRQLTEVHRNDGEAHLQVCQMCEPMQQQNESIKYEKKWTDAPYSKYLHIESSVRVINSFLRAEELMWNRMKNK